MTTVGPTNVQLKITLRQMVLTRHIMLTTEHCCRDFPNSGMNHSENCSPFPNIPRQRIGVRQANFRRIADAFSVEIQPRNRTGVHRLNPQSMPPANTPHKLLPVLGSPLTLAARWGHLKVVKQLISAGADVNEETVYSRTPLVNAAQAGHIEIVVALLDAAPTLMQTQGE